MEQQRKFTEDDVAYLIKARKYIQAIPPVEQEYGGWSIIESEVRKKEDFKPVPGGLIIKARAKSFLAGTPRGYPSCSLLWHGYRIRCVDYEIRHDNPNGTVVRGWHEHIWNDEDIDARVIRARPQITKPDLRAIFKWGLKKWKIEVMKIQDELGFK